MINVNYSNKVEKLIHINLITKEICVILIKLKNQTQNLSTSNYCKKVCVLYFNNFKLYMTNTMKNNVDYSSKIKKISINKRCCFEERKKCVSI